MVWIAGGEFAMGSEDFYPEERPVHTVGVDGFAGEVGRDLVPGVEVTVVEKHPFDGPLVVQIDGQTRTIGERVARQVYVTRIIHAPGPVEGNSARPHETSEPTE